ncbi:MAG: L,D-transpeptidase family protein [Desulfuromonadaceae bacterium]|nr:L,D-transpeptidase family protein [Desulfuromonadaceae bacterium]
MKILFAHKTLLIRSLTFSVFAFTLFVARISSADTRLDAISAIAGLRMTGLAKKMPDEMKSLDATFAIAEQYYQANDTTNSDQYYLLTIQKARILAAGAANQTALLQFKAYEQTVKPDILQNKATPDSAAPATTNPAPAPPSVAETTDAEQGQEVHSVEIVSETLVGTTGAYTVIKGDTLRLVAAKLGVSRQHLSRINKLDAKAPLKIGQQLKYNNRKIIPLRMQEGIVVNIPDRTLYYFQQGKMIRSLPVALGTPTKNEKYVWQTPTGKFKITSKQKNPTWYVPTSIQAEMEEEGKDVLISVPPGPDNPLGKFAIKTSIPGILIHSTTQPWSIYSFASHGCIRVYPAQMEDFFKEVKVNTPGEIIYQPVKLAVTEQGRVFLEVHRDVYSKSIGLAAEARKLIIKNRLSDRVDWKKFESVVTQKLGIAEDITM